MPETDLNNEEASISTLQYCAITSCWFFGFCIHCASPVVFACFLVRCRGGCADPIFASFFRRQFSVKKSCARCFRLIAPSSTATLFSTPCCRVPSNFVHCCNDARPPRPNAATTSTTVPWLLSITGVVSMKKKCYPTLCTKMCVYNYMG